MKKLKLTAILARPVVFSLLLLFMHNITLHAQSVEGSIQPYSGNAFYWQYRGSPLVLMGGTDEDNLFQWTGWQLTSHLDLLVSSGGNYVRNTMSDRDEGNVYAHKQIKSGTYDLNQWNDEYWNRLTFFLDETSKRGIIVQLTLWDVFDTNASNWPKHPWNPENNTNMSPGSWNSNDDFYATLARKDETGLEYQQKFINKLLSVALKYDHVLYNINNESSQGTQWENYWAQYIHTTAESHDHASERTGYIQMYPSK